MAAPQPLGGITPSFPPSLLLLADSALPLGSFAFSSGLESYLAHHAPAAAESAGCGAGRGPRATATGVAVASSASAPLSPFLALSIASVGSTTLPYVLAGYRHPARLPSWDNDLDAATPCRVARRASLAQGRALLGLWEKAFRPASVEAAAHTLSGLHGLHGTDDVGTHHADQDAQVPSPAQMKEAGVALNAFAKLLKSSSLSSASSSSSSTLAACIPEAAPNGHLAPLWGAVCASQGLALHDTAYLFLFNHARAVLSAAVRAGALGPYQAQTVLASAWLRERVQDGLRQGWDVDVENAGQCAPVVDLWVGRHELLYSRIFNS